MALKALLDTLDGIDEGMKTHYVPSEDGTFRLDIEGGFKTSAEVQMLSNTLGKERVKASEAEKALKAFEGLDPSAARDALKKLDAWTEDQSKAAEKIQAELDARLAPVSAERDKFKALADERGQKIDDFTVSEALRAAKVFEKVEDPIYLEHLRLKAHSSLKVVDGKLVGFKADGTQVFDANGNPAQGEDLIAGIVNSIPDVSKYFAGSSANGSGSTSGGTQRQIGANVPKSFSDCKTDAEKVAYLENNANLKHP